ncbi:MAG: electron transfer flavoprotein subunit beta, partial [Chloroflexi bacterium]|nr:electron transfer flavoprotein subunit beta [Chloroflexota bacterium]
VFFGMASTDAATTQVAPKVAALLNLPLHSYSSKVEIGDGEVKSNRQTDKGYDVVGSGLPAVISVLKGINEPRYPSLKGIMMAKRAEITVWSLADIDGDASRVGREGAREKVLGFTQTKGRQKGQMVKDDGTAATVIAEFLVASKCL